jgi:ubiquinone/menaquinone biosynthesis C-methylase UbiE
MTPSSAIPTTDVSPFVCPTCKGILVNLRCSACNIQYADVDGIPNFIPRSSEFKKALDISATYDEIYSDHSGVCEDQGREADFRKFFARLAGELSTQRLLEIGCGEGLLLECLHATSKCATDMSGLALKKAKARTGAACAAAMAEKMPFPDQSFDLVVSVGVMEHFLDEHEANREIRRVLKPGGYYLVLIHTHMSLAQRLRQELREYIFPRFRPWRLLKWITKKTVRPVCPADAIRSLPLRRASSAVGWQ